MAKKKDVVFRLDIQGGAEVLQEMAKPLVTNVSRDIANKAQNRCASDGREVSFDIEVKVGAPNKRGGMRIFGRVKPTGDEHQVYEVRKSHILEKAAGSANIK